MSSFGQTTTCTAINEFVDVPENVAEAKTEDGNTIYWVFERHMYHSASYCPVLVATARGRAMRKQSSCQVCVRPNRDLVSL